MKVLVLGEHGQLAQALAYSQPAQLKVTYLGRSGLVPLNQAQLNSQLDAAAPDLIINAAAWTDVDLAELATEQCSLLNTQLVRWLVQWASALGTPLIHISTDYVFNGLSTEPYTEEVRVSPLNQYGASKLAAEQHLLLSYAQHSLILRTSWLYSGFGSNFLVKLLAILQKEPQQKVSMVTDQWGSPTSALDFAERIWQLVLQPFRPGLYHYAGPQCVSRFEFATFIVQRALHAGLLAGKVEFSPVRLNSFAATAKRPLYSCLDSSLLLGIQGWSQLGLSADIDRELQVLCRPE
ncbi:dTDP-4-dehydrorhamnose reductase [Rheinheimera sp.]|uniref:dTDP-4-dehydrorhamnose reductase n=1 Tax=Rheinheimera sp. TaxID=1869214 RepID=UPI00307EC859